MKSLLISTLVLAFASAANADPNGWSLWVADGNSPGVAPSYNDYELADSEITLAPGNYLWIGVHNYVREGFGGSQWTLYLVFMDSPFGEWTGNYTQYLEPFFENTYYGLYEGMDIWEVMTFYGTPDPAGDLVGITDAMEFHSLGAGDIEVILLDNDAATVIDTFIIHQTSLPVIELSSTEFQFYAVYGGENPSDQILAISNSGAGTLNWQISEDCNWLTAEPNSGSSTGDPNFVFLSVDIAGLDLGVYDCNLTVSDPCAFNSPQTVQVELVIEECYAGMPDYNEWAEVGKPECWCYPRQCHGDAEGTYYGTPILGYFYVNARDLDIMSIGWLVKDPPKGSGILNLQFDGVPAACADFARDKQGNAYLGYWRIGSNDLDAMSLYWMVSEPPKGSGTPPDCLPGNREP